MSATPTVLGTAVVPLLGELESETFLVELDLRDAYGNQVTNVAEGDVVIDVWSTVSDVGTRTYRGSLKRVRHDEACNGSAPNAFEGLVCWGIVVDSHVASLESSLNVAVQIRGGTEDRENGGEHHTTGLVHVRGSPCQWQAERKGAALEVVEFELWDPARETWTHCACLPAMPSPRSVTVQCRMVIHQSSALKGIGVDQRSLQVLVVATESLEGGPSLPIHLTDPHVAMGTKENRATTFLFASLTCGVWTGPGVHRLKVEGSIPGDLPNTAVCAILSLVPEASLRYHVDRCTGTSEAASLAPGFHYIPFEAFDMKAAAEPILPWMAYASPRLADFLESIGAKDAAPHIPCILFDHREDFDLQVMMTSIASCVRGQVAASGTIRETHTGNLFAMITFSFLGVSAWDTPVAKDLSSSAPATLGAAPAEDQRPRVTACRGWLREAILSSETAHRGRTVFAGTLAKRIAQTASSESKRLEVENFATLLASYASHHVSHRSEPSE